MFNPPHENALAKPELISDTLYSKGSEVDIKSKPVALEGIDTVIENKIYKLHSPKLYPNKKTKKTISDVTFINKFSEMLNVNLGHNKLKDTLLVNEIDTLKCKISLDKPIEEIKSELKSQLPSHSFEFASIKLAHIIRATLSCSDSGIVILPIKTQDGVLEQNSDANFTWYVKSIKTGVYDLTLSIISILRREGMEVHKQHDPPYLFRFTVYAKPEKFSKLLLKWISNHYEYLFTALLIPVFKWGFQRYKNKRNKHPLLIKP